jgi:hypothetical protein
LARKSGNTSIFQIDKTSFFWTMKCGSCHPGAGPGKLDRDGEVYWDGTNFGYENLGKTVDDVYNGFDGDYTFLNPMTLQYIPAPWNATGVSEADCFVCHLTGYSRFNKTVTHGGGPNLFSVTGYRAFQVAPSAGAGWAEINDAAIQRPPGQLPFLQPTLADDFVINYEKGITAGTLVDVAAGQPLQVDSSAMVGSVPDANCRGCHANPDVRKMGRSWADNTDVHKAAGVACVECHPSGSNATDTRMNTKNQHDFAKGDSSIHSASDVLDDTMANCEGCHVNGEGNVAAPDPTATHAAIFKDVNGADVSSQHFAKISCEACHIPYKEDDVGTPPDPDLLIDMSMNGGQVVYPWSDFFAMDHVNPDPTQANPTGRWYPSLIEHNGKIFVAKPLVTIWWGEWNGQMSGNEVVEPYPLWQVRQAVGFDGTAVTNPAIVAVLTDDTGDGIPEVNTQLEIATYINELKNATLQVTDRDSNPVTQPGVGSNPVLVTGSRIFYVSDNGATVGDPSDDVVSSFASPLAERAEFSIHHNVQDSTKALGAGGCTDCHAFDKPFFNRKTVVDPWEFPGDSFTSPNYVNAWEIMDYTQAEVDGLTASVPALPTAAGGGGSSGCAISGSGGSIAGGAGALGILLIVLLWFALTRQQRVKRQ